MNPPTTDQPLPFPGASDAAISAANSAEKATRRVGEAQAGDAKAAKAARRHAADLLRHSSDLSGLLGRPTVVVGRADLLALFEAYQDLRSLAAIIPCGRDADDCDEEGRHNEDAHRGVLVPVARRLSEAAGVPLEG